jgi:CubicO group peptidase (beta-lactamase class C family)
MKKLTFTIASMLLAFLAASLNSGLFAAHSIDEAVDTYVQAEMSREHIPGLALGVYRHGEIVRVQGFGLSNVELGVAVKPETVFQSGSIGKQFTATAIIMLMEQGKLSLTDSIAKFFPNAPSTWKIIQVRHLLSHTSGLQEYTDDDKTRPGGAFNLRADYTEDQILKIMESFPIEYQPGEKWDYRNTNYVLLGIIIHRVTGKFYGDYLRECIFGPLGMSATRIISEADIIPNRAAGYRLVHGELKNQEWISPSINSTADGTLYFNVLDLARWDAALYTERLLRKSSLDQMWTVAALNNGKPNPGNYGFAWRITQAGSHRLIEHGGAWQGFTAYIARYVDDQFTIVVLTNLDSDHSNPSRIAHHIAHLYLPDVPPQ